MTKSARVTVKEIINAMREKRCVAFVGAGVSVNAGLPSWATLIHQLFDALKSKGKVSPAAEATFHALSAIGEFSDPSAIVELMLLTVKRLDLVNELRTVLSPAIPMSDVHKTLRSLSLRGFVTTNYDRLLDDVVAQNAFKLRNSFKDFRTVATAVAAPGTQFLLKLHGDLDDILPPDDMEVSRGESFVVLTRSDYTALVQGNRGEAMALALHSITQQSSILFLGYSYSDPDIRHTLNYLSQHCLFSHPSWFIGLKSDQKPSLPPNVEFVQPISDWSEFPAWLNSLWEELKADPLKAAGKPESPKAASEEDVRALRALGEYLVGLESEDLCLKTLVSILVPNLLGATSVSKDTLAPIIEKVLEVGPVWGQTFAKATLAELSEMKLVQPEKGSEEFRVITTRVQQLHKRANREWEDERNKFVSSVERRLVGTGQVVDQKFIARLELVLDQLCMNFGQGMAEWIQRGAGRELGTSYIDSIAATHFSDAEEKRKVAELLSLVFDSPADDEVGYLYRLLSSAFLLNSVKLDPTASKFLKESVAQYQLFLDSNVLLPLLIAEHRNHDWMVSVMKMSREAGVSLAVLEDFLEEVIGHRQVAQEIYRDYGGDLKTLAQYGSSLGLRGNLFIDGFIRSSSRRRLSWKDYLSNYSDRKLREELARLEISLLQVKNSDLNAKEFAEVLSTLEIEWESRLRGHIRNSALNRHEAKQFLYIYTLRDIQRASKSSEDIWFLSSETVFEKVYLRDPQKWGKAPTFPVSAWVGFLDSRMAFSNKNRKDILRAILRGNSTTYSMPDSVALVRKKAFGEKVLSKEEHEALTMSLSSGSLVTRMDKARSRFLKKGRQDPTCALELDSAEEALVGEIQSELSDTINGLNERIRRGDQRSSEEIAGLKKQVHDLGERLKIMKKPNRK